MKILPTFSHPHVLPNLITLFLLWNTKDDILRNVALFYVNIMEGYHYSSIDHLLCYTDEEKVLSLKPREGE